MAKAVFISRVDPEYDDLPEARYHFPRTYLGTARQTVGDWIVYYEPRRNGGRQVYFAAARVVGIDPDPNHADHFYARIIDYLEFPSPVPFRTRDRYMESGLRMPDGSVNAGLFQRAVHLIPDPEYELIVQVGLHAERAANSDTPELMVAESPAEYARPRVETLVNRPVRDEAFQKVVRAAYDSTCAMTGLQLINGGGRCEIEAAHIRPVEKDGPDSPRNGLALSRTCHWMFDHGILSVDDDGKILMARRLVSDQVKRMLNPDGRIRLPEVRLVRPHSQFLRYHRENVFKG
jgi:putative restriction endonuclease